MIFILLPAFNEEAALDLLLPQIDESIQELGAHYKVVVVNDGSNDDTPNVLERLSKKYPMEIITHRYNRGLGETIRDGLEYVAKVGKPEDIVIRMDCDDTHDPKYIAPMIKKMSDGYEVVIASRYVPGGGQEGLDWYRRTISRIANLLMKFVFPIPGIKEYTCGYRAYRVSLIQDAIEIFGNQFIDLKGMGFTGTVEKIIKCRMMGVRIAEVPFVLMYHRKPGDSKVVTNLTTLGYFVLIAKYMAYWGDIGRQWKIDVAERKLRRYGADGTRPLPPLNLD